LRKPKSEKEDTRKLTSLSKPVDLNNSESDAASSERNDSMLPPATTLDESSSKRNFEITNEIFMRTHSTLRDLLSRKHVKKDKVRQNGDLDLMKSEGKRKKKPK
jgi:hypothetical protein